MHWNWELPHWPNFTYYSHQIAQQEKQFREFHHTRYRLNLLS